MSKHLLEKTKQDFVDFMATQDDNVWWVAATTPLNSNTEFAHFRRSFLRTINNINLKALKS